MTVKQLAGAKSTTGVLMLKVRPDATSYSIKLTIDVITLLRMVKLGHLISS